MVSVGWVLFAFEDMGRGWTFLKAMFGGGTGFINSDVKYLLLTNLPLLIVCVIASTPLVKNLYAKFTARSPEGAVLTTDVVRILVLYGLSMAYLVSGSYNPFLYFRF